MASFPDGTIITYRYNPKNKSVYSETSELIKCKNCEYCSIETENLDDGTPVTNEYCNVFKRMTNPEGYCHMATRKGVLNGR